MGVRLFTLVTYKYKYFVTAISMKDLDQKELTQKKCNTIFSSFLSPIMSDSLLNCDLAWLVSVTRL